MFSPDSEIVRRLDSQFRSNWPEVFAVCPAATPQARAWTASSTTTITEDAGVKRTMTTLCLRISTDLSRTQERRNAQFREFRPLWTTTSRNTESKGEAHRWRVPVSTPASTGTSTTDPERMPRLVQAGARPLTTLTSWRMPVTAQGTPPSLTPRGPPVPPRRSRGLSQLQGAPIPPPRRSLMQPQSTSAGSIRDEGWEEAQRLRGLILKLRNSGHASREAQRRAKGEFHVVLRSLFETGRVPSEVKCCKDSADCPW